MVSRLKTFVVAAGLMSALAMSAAAEAAVVTWTMTGALTSVYSQNQSSWVNGSTATCQGCGAYANVGSAADGSQVGLNALTGDAFTMTYTFDTDIAANQFSSGTTTTPGMNTYAYTQTTWNQVAGHGVLGSTINGQNWTGAERYSVIGGDWTTNDPNYCVNCDASNDYIYAENYFQNALYTNSALDYFGNPYGPITYTENGGVAFSGPGPVNGVLGNPNGYAFYGSTAFNLARYMWAMAWSSMLTEIPVTVNLADYPDTRLVQWAGTGFSDYGCDYAVGSGDATYCAWNQISSYNIAGVIESITSSVAAPVPAPAPLALMVFGLVSLGALRWKISSPMKSRRA